MRASERDYSELEGKIVKFVDWTHLPFIHCVPNKSKLTLGSCQVNQQEALKGAYELINGQHLSLIPDHQLERLMACAACEYCKLGLPIERIKKRLIDEFKKIAEEFERMDWYGKDNEVRAVRKKELSRKRYQERHHH